MTTAPAWLTEATYFGVLASIAAYALGVWLRRVTRCSWLNPLLVAVVLVIVVLKACHLPYATYNRSASLITYLLTPSTICLAVPLYQQLALLRRHKWAVVAGTLTGVLSSLCIIVLLSALLHLDHTSYVTFLPKSITTAIGIGVATELGGRVPIAVAVIILTGILGSIVAEKWLALLRITHPVARGIALGSSAHAIGTAKAMEMGAVEGSMSSLSIVVCGVCTVVLAPLFAAWL